MCLISIAASQLSAWYPSTTHSMTASKPLWHHIPMRVVPPCCASHIHPSRPAYSPLITEDTFIMAPKCRHTATAPQHHSQPAIPEPFLTKHDYRLREAVRRCAQPDPQHKEGASMCAQKNRWNVCMYVFMETNLEANSEQSRPCS